MAIFINVIKDCVTTAYMYSSNKTFFSDPSDYKIKRVGVILGKNQLDYWILENPTNSKLEKWGCIPWIFYLLE